MAPDAVLGQSRSHIFSLTFKILKSSSFTANFSISKIIDYLAIQIKIVMQIYSKTDVLHSKSTCRTTSH